MGLLMSNLIGQFDSQGMIIVHGMLTSCCRGSPTNFYSPYGSPTFFQLSTVLPHLSLANAFLCNCASHATFLVLFWCVSHIVIDDSLFYNFCFSPSSFFSFLPLSSLPFSIIFPSPLFQVVCLSSVATVYFTVQRTIFQEMDSVFPVMDTALQVGARAQV